MAKIQMKPATMIYPLPAVMVSCGAYESEYNIITVSWTGTINSIPPMCYISVRPERHSYKIIKKNKAFVINLTNQKLAKVTDWCGTKSGRDFNKFEEMNLTPVRSQIIKAPLIEESPINIECAVKDIIHLGSHDMFIADVVNILVEDEFFDTKTGTFNLLQGKPITYFKGFYYELGEMIGRSGFSVKKK